MFDYRVTVVAPLSHREPLAYSMAPRTVPTLVSRFTNLRPPVQNGTTLSFAKTGSALLSVGSTAV
jgi:hypothetical protein